MLEKGANTNAKGGIYGNALSAACYAGHIGVVRLLLKKGANIDAESGLYCTALSAASSEGYEEVIRLLLEKKADVNAQSGLALREESESCRVAVMRLLLKNKANVNLLFHDDAKELRGILLDDHEAVIRVLLKEISLFEEEEGFQEDFGFEEEEEEEEHDDDWDDDTPIRLH